MPYYKIVILSAGETVLDETKKSVKRFPTKLAAGKYLSTHKAELGNRNLCEFEILKIPKVSRE